LEDGGLEMVAQVTNLLSSFPDFDGVALHKLAESLSKPEQDEQLRSFAHIVLWLVQTLLRSRAGGEGGALPPPLDQPALYALRDHYSLPDWIDIAAQLQAHFDSALNAHLERRQVVIGAFSRIGRRL